MWLQGAGKDWSSDGAEPDRGKMSSEKIMSFKEVDWEEEREVGQEGFEFLTPGLPGRAVSLDKRQNENLRPGFLPASSRGQKLFTFLHLMPNVKKVRGRETFERQTEVINRTWQKKRQ